MLQNYEVEGWWRWRRKRWSFLQKIFLDWTLFPDKIILFALCL